VSQREYAGLRGVGVKSFQKVTEGRKGSRKRKRDKRDGKREN